MTTLEYPPLPLARKWSAATFNKEHTTLSEVLLKHKPGDNSYINLFADLIRKHGKQKAKQYGLMLGADPRQFDGTIRCMSSISALDRTNEYFRLAACDMQEQTKLPLSKIAEIMGLSASSFPQFSQAYQHIESYRCGSLKQKN